MAFPKQLGGVIVMSGYYFGNSVFRPCIANEDTEVFIYHGENDRNILL